MLMKAFVPACKKHRQYESKAFSNSNASACDTEMRRLEGGALNIN
jgi:ribosomal protein L44E